MVLDSGDLFALGLALGFVLGWVVGWVQGTAPLKVKVKVLETELRRLRTPKQR
jgi:hypothetical protein